MCRGTFPIPVLVLYQAYVWVGSRSVFVVVVQSFVGACVSCIVISFSFVNDKDPSVVVENQEGLMLVQ